MSRFEFFVAGKPAPQGSKRYMGRSGGHGVMVESSKAVAPWRADVRAGAEQALTATQADRFAAGEAVAITLVFVMPRPASAPKKRTPQAVKRPDVDKLARAVLDALSSAGIWQDDSQVVDLHASKHVALLNQTPGCQVSISLAAALTDDAGRPHVGPVTAFVEEMLAQPVTPWQQSILDSENDGKQRLAQLLNRPIRG